MIVGVPKESYPQERRVALIPASVPALVKSGLEVVIERQAGEASGFADSQYVERGAKLGSREEVFSSNVVLLVRAAGANPVAGAADLARLKPGQAVVGHCDPLGNPQAVAQVAATGAVLFALELIPRITRAQAMDVLSSQATVAGYRAVLVAAIALPKIFPMMMTAAGTISPARVFVIGAGVAGLQAIATARRLGGVVRAYDVRPAVKEQVESLGAKFVEMPLETSGAEGAGGYAKAMDEDFYRRQRELMAEVVSESDVVITTAAIPGKRSPLLITREAVERMPPGAVIVDLAAERGGNCELTKADQVIEHNGVTILGPTNLASEAPQHASQMYAKNVTTFLASIIKQGQLSVDLTDEVVRDTLLCRGGQVVHPRVRELLGLPPVAEEPKP
jgi:H+-translocating NAD(P) transhydrogenase subunit alpha